MNKYNDITYAEFRGKVLTSLDYIKEDIKEVKSELKNKACKKDIDNLKKEISSIKLISRITVAIGAALTAIGTILGLKRLQ